MAAKWGKRGNEIVGGALRPDAEEPKRISNTLEHVVVAENKPQPRNYKALAKKLTHDKKRVRIAATTLVGLVVLSVFATVLLREKEAPTAIPEGPRCSYAVLEKSKLLLSPAKADKLHKVVGEIEAMPGYDQDPNCLFVAITYYINTSDAPKARDLLKKLETAYDPGEGYETVILDVSKEPAELKPVVEFLEKQASSTQNIGPDGALR